jgi:hypothetical protein
MLGLPLVLALALAAEGPPLPERLGAFARGEVQALFLSVGDRAIFNEFGFKAAFRAEYVDHLGRRMVVEAFRFLEAEGAHAAYLCSRPANAVSPWIYQIDAVTGGGVTVLEYRNYMLRFHGALPSISSSLEEMLAKLPGLVAGSSPWDLSGRYVDHLSTRAILGPVSLRKFSSSIPPTAVGFHLGATGRVASFETPAGRITAVAFRYPSQAVAWERAKVLAQLPDVVVRVERACVGVIFGPVDLDMQDRPLSGHFCDPIEFDFNESAMWNGGVSLGESIGGTLFVGLILGSLIAARRQFSRNREPFPERMIFLRL